MRVAVVGSAGQLGTDIVPAFRRAGHEVTPLAHDQVEVTHASSVKASIERLRPNVVVNCAAYVRVDQAEDEVSQAFAVNAIGALNVARACAEVGGRCVYVSTDYVFDGEQDEPYTETDAPRPINVYGASKLAGELLVRQTCSRWLVVRVASLFGRAGSSGKGGNFIEAILGKARSGERLRIVDDIRISPTYTRDAAEVIRRLVQRDATGVVHVTNSGTCTWYDLVKRAVELCGIDADVEPVAADTYPSRAARPRNSSLDNSLACRLGGGSIPGWEDALSRYLAEKDHLKRDHRSESAVG